MTTEPRRRRIRPSARLRILGWILVLTTLAVVGGLLLSRRLLFQQNDAEVNRGLEQEADEVRRLAEGQDPATGQPFGDDVEAIFDTFLRRNLPSEGEVFYTFVDGRFFRATTGPVLLGTEPAAGDRWATLTEPAHGTLSTDAGRVRWLAVTLDDDDGQTLGVFVVANFLREKQEEIRDVVYTGLAVSGAILMLAGLAGWIIAGRILRPVKDVTDTARAITESDLSRRIDADRDDEVGELAHTFNAMLDRLETAFAAQQAFVGDAGHELRTPITVVRGHLELLGDDPEERRDTVALVTDELDRMSRIVDDLLLLAKLQHPALLHREPFEVEPFTVEQFAKVQALGDRRWRLAETGTGRVVADGQRLTQALMNLARNAVEHTEPGASITLGSSLNDGDLHIWVADDGPGIAPEDQESIFERFARGRDGRRRSEGAGLGLAIVAAVVDAHGGRVTLESRPGAGSRFTISIPTRPEEDPPWPAS